MKHELKLYRFIWDCGHGEIVEGLFIATPAKIEALVGEYVELGAVLGQHSHLAGVIEPYDIKEIPVSLATIIELKETIGNKRIRIITQSIGKSRCFGGTQKREEHRRLLTTVCLLREKGREVQVTAIPPYADSVSSEGMKQNHYITNNFSCKQNNIRFFR